MVEEEAPATVLGGYWQHRCNAYCRDGVHCEGSHVLGPRRLDEAVVAFIREDFRERWDVEVTDVRPAPELEPAPVMIARGECRPDIYPWGRWEKAIPFLVFFRLGEGDRP